MADDAAKFTKPGEGFPPGFEYRWADGVNIIKPMRCSSPEYVDYVMTWVEDQINNEDIFPVQESQSFPADFEKYVKDIFKRLFRVFAIIYHRHFQTIEQLDAAAHLNTCFKHFCFFVLEFALGAFLTPPHPGSPFGPSFRRLPHAQACIHPSIHQPSSHVYSG